MAVEYLGEQFDIHTGGIDHIPVHHTNEIAQAEAATGKKPFVKYWVHHNHLFVDKTKMSKSLGNFFTIDDVEKREIKPEALRLLLLTSHYRSEMNFTWANLEGMQKNFEKIVNQLRIAKNEKGRTVLSPEKLEKVDAYREEFFGYMEDDLKTPEAVSMIWEVLKSNIPGEDKYDLIVEFDEVLGLQLAKNVALVPEVPTEKFSLKDLPADVQQLVSEREAARKAKNWQRADELRNKIVELGFGVSDEADGQKLTKAVWHAGDSE